MQALSPEVHAEQLIPIVLENEFLTHFILRWDLLQPKLKEWREEFTEGRAPQSLLLERTLLLIGKQATRNYIASLAVLKITGRLPRKKSDRFQIQPAETVKYAIKAETFAEDNGLPESGMAFLAGLHFDLLRASLTAAQAPKEASTLIEREWDEWVKRAYYASLLGTRSHGIKKGETLFSLTLLMRLGRVVQAARAPRELETKSFTTFIKGFDERWISPFLERKRERGSFEFTELEWGALLVATVNLAPQFVAPLLFREEPYLLGKESRDFESVCRLITESDWNFPVARREFRLDLPGGTREQLRKKIL